MELPPINDLEQQTPEEKGLADYVKKYFDDCRTASNRVAHEAVWMSNTAYLLGFDSLYNASTRSFIPTSNTGNASGRGYGNNRSFNNLILPAVQNRQARLVKQPPKFEVIPEDNSNEAKEAARLGREVLLQLWDECKVNLKRLPLTMWLQQCGHAYLHVGFDDEQGEPLIDPMSGDIIGFEGKVVVEPESAFACFPDPLATTLEECMKFGRAKVRKLDYFKTRYPNRGHLVKEEGAWLLSIQYQQRINSMANGGITTGSGGNQPQMMKDAAIELTYYEKRSRKHPGGRMVTVANGVVLEEGPLPVGEIPFAKFDDVLIAGKYYSEATITHARPLQDQYNRTLSRRAQWTNNLLAGKYMAARGHGLAPESLDDTSGEVLEYDPVANAAPPTAVQVPSIPEYAYRESDDLENQLNKIFGLSEVSRGQLPSSSIPAVGMQLLLEQDETRIGVEVEQHEHSYARVGTLILLNAAKSYTMDRNLVQKSRMGDISIRKFTGKDLPKKPDVRVVRGSTIPTSATLRKQDVMNAYNAGLLGNPQDPLTQEQVLEMLEFGNSEGIFRKAALDSAQARRDILSIEEGVKPLIYKFDNHEFLCQKLNEYRISDKGVALAPDKKALLEQVIEERGAMIAKLADPQIDQMQNNVDDGLSAVEGEPLLDEIQQPETAPIDQGSIPPLQ